jgi:hypothetical protein
MLLTLRTGPKCGSTIADLSEQEQPQGSDSSNDNGGAQSNPSSTSPQPETSHDGCKIVGATNEAKQQNGHLGDSVVGAYKYTNCTVEGKGAQLNGSAFGEQGMAIATSLFGGSGMFNGRT